MCAPRLRVVDAFDRAARKRFVYVAAPAGSGKTVSALLWLKKAKLPTVWIGLDRYDDVPSVFYQQVATGLYSTQTENEAMRRVLTSLRSRFARGARGAADEHAPPNEGSSWC